MRNGDGGQPLWLSRSADGGKTWAEVEKIAVGAAYGDLLVLSDGTLLLTYGRPGTYVMGSTDGGRTWDVEHKALIGTRSSAAYVGRAALAEIAPGHVVCVYNDMTSLHARILTIRRE
jgi:photosystem II stability/assembly factor-like uncharacterized protein